MRSGRHFGIGSRRFWVRLFPKSLGDLSRVDLEILPPDYFIAGLMQLSVVAATERNRKFVTDFEAQGSGLSKPQVMRIDRVVRPRILDGLSRRRLGSAMAGTLLSICAGKRPGVAGTIEVSPNGCTCSLRRA